MLPVLIIFLHTVHNLPAAVVVIPQAAIQVARVHPAHLVQVVMVMAMIIAHITQALIMVQLRLTPIPTHTVFSILSPIDLMVFSLNQAIK